MTYVVQSVGRGGIKVEGYTETWHPSRFVKESPTSFMYGRVAQEDWTTPPDPISPPHYARYKIEPITFIMENDLPFAVGSVVKYVCRFDAKNGLEDLRKAKRYVELLIEQAEKKAA